MKKYMGQPLFLVGIIFAPIGGVFLVIGMIIALKMRAIMHSPNSYGDVRMLPIIFCALGGLFFLMGLMFMMTAIRKVRKKDAIIEKGHAIYAEVTNIYMNRTVMINGSHPFLLECIYEDEYTREKHGFRSDNIFFAPPDVIGQQVRVYVEPSDYSQYHVDIESLFGKVTMH